MNAGDSSSTRLLQHGRITLALHQLGSASASAARPLLILHDLGGSSPINVPPEFGVWEGAIYALDFTGHGQSSVPRGGGYTAEVLMADVDAALAEIGSATVYGRGLGGYVALLIAGARPSLIHGAIIDDGVGLAGGGTTVHSVHLEFAAAAVGILATPDPYALLELSTDVRPTDYAVSFVQAAVQGSTANPAVAVVASARPLWLVSVLEQYGAEAMTLPEALASYLSR